MAILDIDIGNYAEKINAEEDHQLFDEAVKAAKAGALRAAYVMIWLSCAESLKRRFREASKRDNTAGKIVGEIETIEKGYKAVDKFVLEKAKEYGFIAEYEYTLLNQIYEKRCLYGHPYEQAPIPEQVTEAAATVVEYVLCKPVKLKHGFGQQLLKKLLEELNFLDDQESAVVEFAKDIIPRIDESIYCWLLDAYWENLEKISQDPLVSIFFRRGIWFSRALLREVGVDVFSHDDWHDRISTYPKTLIQLCTTADIFSEIGEPAQNSLVGSIIEESKTRASVLAYLERLNDGMLTKRQQERYIQRISGMGINDILAAGLRTKTCYDKLINALKRHNWYVQNPAIDLIISNGPEQAAELDENQQVNLGRNILQAAEGSATSAITFLERLSKGSISWPFNLVRGMALESFTNEDNKIRFKLRHLQRILSAINNLPRRRRDQLMHEISLSVSNAIPKYFLEKEEFEQTINLLKDYNWSKPLVESLKNKAASLNIEMAVE
jgi:hypothetical protein